MTTEAEPTPPEDSELDAVLKAVARPESVGTRLLHELQTVDLPIAEQQRAQVMAALHGAVADGRALAPDALIDHSYRLTRRLGSGGMGVVFAAQNVRTGKQVAIKWMNVRPRGENAVSAARFRREARAAARIRHPNVVDVYDVGGDEDAPYLVMELLEGESLRSRLARGALSWDEALSVLHAALSGVAAAHAQGVVHRDLKPDNIFLCTNPLAAGAAPTVKVLDFGVASVRDGAGGDELASLTRTGSVLGTPAYMPLEQLKGERVDARADLYALGVVLYEMLTQRLPFSARGASELAVKQATEAPTPVSVHRPELRGQREAALMKALARRASDRYADAQSFALALTRARAGTRQRRVVALGVLALVCAAALGTWLHAAAQRSEPRDARAPVTAQARPTAGATQRPSLTTAPPTQLVQPVHNEEAPAPKAARRRAPGARAKPAPSPADAPHQPPRRPTDLGFDDF